MPTFQQTFANCPFPEGILSVVGSYPVQVRVNRAQRAMDIIATGASVSQEILTQAAEALRRAFGLSTVTVQVDAPSAVEPSPEPPVPAPAAEPASVLTAEPPQDLETQMRAMRKKLLRKDIPSSGGKKNRVKQIYGKITGKRKPVPMNELTLDMGSVLVEGEVFNIEHRELPRRKAWVACFDITDLTSSIRVTRFRCRGG